MYSDLKRLGMPLGDLPNWICQLDMVKAESACNSGSKGPMNKNGVAKAVSVATVIWIAIVSRNVKKKFF